MARYIDADLALELKDKNMNYVYDLYDLEDFLAGVPAADVVEEKFGEWKLKHIGVGHYWECSQCENRLCGLPRTNYCPNCGAKMDGRSDGDDVL